MQIQLKDGTSETLEVHTVATFINLHGSFMVQSQLTVSHRTFEVGSSLLPCCLRPMNAICGLDQAASAGPRDSTPIPPEIHSNDAHHRAKQEKQHDTRYRKAATIKITFWAKGIAENRLPSAS